MLRPRPEESSLRLGGAEYTVLQVCYLFHLVLEKSTRSWEVNIHIPLSQGSGPGTQKLKLWALSASLEGTKAGVTAWQGERRARAQLAPGPCVPHV